MSIRNLRSEYSRGELNEDSIGDDPIRAMQVWLDVALQERIPEPNAMTVATVGPDRRPSTRIVLLRDLSPHGLDFYTNYLSRKGLELAENPHVALQFYWPELERQIRVEGTAARLSAEESDRYFNQRPYETRLGAVASQQSRRLDSRAVLHAEVDRLRQLYPDGGVPRPEHWGGYRVTPNYFEFWQGRPSRLHDRIVFERVEETWNRYRLWP